MLFKILDRCLYHCFFKSYYKRKFKSYGANVRWGKHSARLCIPRSVRISCAEKISIGDNCQFDEGVYLQCHYNGDGIDIGNGCRLNAHTHVLSYSKITLEDKVLIAPFSLISSGNHGTSLDIPIMDQEHCPAGEIKIGAGSWVGQGGKILGGVFLGRNTTVASGAVVTKTFLSERQTLVGVPARCV